MEKSFAPVRYNICLKFSCAGSLEQAAIPPAEFSQQLTIRTKPAAERLLHTDPAKNLEAMQLFDAEFAAAQPGFVTSIVKSFGVVTN